METLSVVIPAHNEEDCVAGTLVAIAETLSAEHIPFEIVVVDDHSSDGTAAAVADVASEWPAVRCVQNLRRNGFGNAIHTGLDAFTGDAVVIVMADASDDPRDIVAYWRELCRGYDCAFGSRFMRGAKVVDYPGFKLTLNRLANAFGIRPNDEFYAMGR